MLTQIQRVGSRIGRGDLKLEGFEYDAILTERLWTLPLFKTYSIDNVLPIR